jgi:hypothetical protein
VIFVLLKGMRRIKIIFTGLTFLIIQGLIAPSCQTQRGEIIPYVKVDEYFLLYSDLADLGVLESKFMKGGYSGLVIYRESDFVFHAYDRTCTLWPQHTAAVVDDTLALRCPECGTIYLPSLGAQPISGPSTYPLIEYNAVVQGDVLHVFN